MHACAWSKSDSGIYCTAIVGSDDVCRCCDLRRRHTMVAVTYGTHRIPTAKTAERAKAAAPRNGLFAPLHGCVRRVASAERPSRDFEARAPVAVHARRTWQSVDQYRRQDAVQRLTTAALPAKPPRCPRPGRFCFERSASCSLNSVLANTPDERLRNGWRRSLDPKRTSARLKSRSAAGPCHTGL